jgi:hypothetical protein
MVASVGMANSRQAPMLPPSSSSGLVVGSARTMVNPHLGSPSRTAQEREEGPRSPRMPGCGTQVVVRSQTSDGTISFRNGHRITSGAASLAKRIMSSAAIGVRM